MQDYDIEDAIVIEEQATQDIQDAVILDEENVGVHSNMGSSFKAPEENPVDKLIRSLQAPYQNAKCMMLPDPLANDSDANARGEISYEFFVRKIGEVMKEHNRIDDDGIRRVLRKLNMK